MNRAIEEANKVLEGIGDLESLQISLYDVDRLLDQLTRVFKYESRFQEKTEFFLKESEIIENNLKKAKEGIRRIQKYFKNPEKRYIEEGLKSSIEAFTELFASFDRLKEQESKQTIYSESPYMNDIMRVADCVKRGVLAPELLKERIDMFLALQKNLAQNFDNMQPTMDERVIFEENRDKIKKKINEVIEGLNLAKTYFLTQRFECVEEGLQKAAEAVKVLIEFEKKLKEAREAPKVKYCFRCGTENPRSVRYCIKCNYNFPPLQIEEEATLDVRLEEGGIQQTGHVMTENLAKLYGAVDGIKSGTISMEEYIQTINWFRDIMNRAMEEEKKIKIPEGGDPEAAEAFAAFKETFDLGMQDIGDGLALLTLYVERQSPDLLETGMEQIMRGGDRLFQVKMVGEQVRMAMAQAKQQKG